MRKIHKPLKCRINYDVEDIKNYHIKQWVWKWVEQFHPEAFKKAEEYVNKNWVKFNVENTTK